MDWLQVIHPSMSSAYEKWWTQILALCFKVLKMWKQSSDTLLDIPTYNYTIVQVQGGCKSDVIYFRWPNPGCCRYDMSVDYERRQSKLKPVHRGLMAKQMEPPQVNVLDVYECEFQPLLPPQGPEKPTILLFWTSWCLSSQKMMEYMFKFAQFNNHKV